MELVAGMALSIGFVVVVVGVAIMSAYIVAAGIYYQGVLGRVALGRSPGLETGQRTCPSAGNATLP